MDNLENLENDDSPSRSGLARELIEAETLAYQGASSDPIDRAHGEFVAFMALCDEAGVKYEGPDAFAAPGGFMAWPEKQAFLDKLTTAIEAMYADRMHVLAARVRVLQQMNDNEIGDFLYGLHCVGSDIDD